MSSSVDSILRHEKIFMNLAMLTIAIISLAMATWVFIESRKARKNSENQLRISTEPKFDIFVSQPNSDPIGLECRNSGVAVDNAQLYIEDKPHEKLYFIYDQQHQIYQSFLKLHLLLLQGKESIRLSIEYRNKLDQLRRINFIYNIQNKKIIEAP